MNRAEEIYEIVIGEIQSELDREYSDYQRLHRKFYLEEDTSAQIIHKQKTDLLKLILRRLLEKYREI